ncbi:transcriptional regulator [Gemmatimonadetes bacterium T265]|nr:transcriptional regulator [Gemmatimonadetes bacterium T265]
MTDLLRTPQSLTGARKEPGTGDPGIAGPRLRPWGDPDRAQLADFLRRRRAALRPADVALPPGARRRTHGLRREEIAALAGMSADYYSRLEQQRGPQPSEAVLAAVAAALRLSPDERDHLFRIAGHSAPGRPADAARPGSGLVRVLECVRDVPAQIVTELAETVRQNRLAVALLGVQTHFQGLDRSFAYRWFTDLPTRRLYPEEDHAERGRIMVADLRLSYSRAGPGSRAAALVQALLARSPEFATLWTRHEVARVPSGRKRIYNPQVGVVEIDCRVLFEPDQAHALLVYTTDPGSEAERQLAVLAESVDPGAR